MACRASRAQTKVQTGWCTTDHLGTVGRRVPLPGAASGTEFTGDRSVARAAAVIRRVHRAAHAGLNGVRAGPDACRHWLRHDLASHTLSVGLFYRSCGVQSARVARLALAAIGARWLTGYAALACALLRFRFVTGTSRSAYAPRVSPPSTWTPYPLRFLFHDKPQAIGPVPGIVQRVIQGSFKADQAGASLHRTRSCARNEAAVDGPVFTGWHRRCPRNCA